MDHGVDGVGGEQVIGNDFILNLRMKEPNSEREGMTAEEMLYSRSSASPSASSS